MGVVKPDGVGTFTAAPLGSPLPVAAEHHSAGLPLPLVSTTGTDTRNANEPCVCAAGPVSVVAVASSVVDPNVAPAFAAGDADGSDVMMRPLSCDGAGDHPVGHAAAAKNIMLPAGTCVALPLLRSVSALQTKARVKGMPGDDVPMLPHTACAAVMAATAVPHDGVVGVNLPGDTDGEKVVVVGDGIGCACPTSESKSAAVGVNAGVGDVPTNVGPNDGARVDATNVRPTPSV